jgi:thiol-disulfide isomerase/thioredoxin
MTTTGLKIAHITIDGKEIDEETDIKAAPDLTQKSSDVLAMYNAKKPMFIKFYATWCGHCKTNDVFWKELVKEARKTPDMNIAIVEVESKNMNKDINKIIETEGFGKVEGFPTIGTIAYPGGKAKFTPYEGDRKTAPMFAVVKALASGKQSGGGAKRKVSRKRTKHKRSGSKRSGSKRSGSKRSGSKRSVSKRSRTKHKRSGIKRRSKRN